MSNGPDLAELRVTFDAEVIRAYGGSSGGFHSDEAVAESRGYPRLVSWGTLTVLPFWELIGRIAGCDWPIGCTLSVRLLKPVCAGDEVVYTIRAHPAASDEPTGRTSFELIAVTSRYGVVATAQATVGSPDVTHNSQGGN